MTFVIRMLTSADQADYLRILGQLSPTTDVATETFETFCETSVNQLKETWVLQPSPESPIVAIGSLYKLIKMARSGTTMGLIEDIVVDQNHRGQNYGRQIVEHLVERAKMTGCYKCVLSASAENCGFYQKIGFQPKEQTLMIYF